MSLFNSMVRGFGSQIGRRAANNMIDSRPTVASKSQWIVTGIAVVGFIGLIGWAVKQDVPPPVSQSTTTSIEMPKSEMYKGHTVYTGKRGGQYYYGKGGKKVYIK